MQERNLLNSQLLKIPGLQQVPEKYEIVEANEREYRLRIRSFPPNNQPVEMTLQFSRDRQRGMSFESLLTAIATILDGAT